MTAEEIAAGIRFVVDSEGHVTNVVLTPELWRRVIEQLENAEDRRLLEQLAPRLGQGPEGTLRWTDVAHEWA